jgi:alpha-L-arabinofuranosidase
MRDAANRVHISDGLRRALAAFLIVPLLSVSAGCQSAPAAKPESPSGRTGPTVIHIGSKVIRSGVKRLGMNMSGQSYYDSGQMLRDLTFRNPGFEGEIWQTVLECKFVKSDACADSDEWSWWPEGFAKGGTFEFFWGAAKGQKGVVSASAPAAAKAHQGVWVSFGNLPVHPQVGDYYILRMKHPGNAAAGWNVETTSGATVDTELKDLSKNSPGKQALRIEASKPYQTATILTGFDTWDNKSFVQMKGSYTLSFRAKGIAGTRELTATVTRLSQNYGNMTYLTHRTPLTTEWQDYKFTFQAHESGNYVGPVHVQIAVNSASLLLDDVSLTEAAADDNPTAFRNAVVTRLRELKPGILRYMDNGTSFGSTIDNLIAPPFARERSGYSEGNKVQEDIPIGIHEFLVLCQAVKADPWISLPVGMTPVEARNLTQYLAAPATTPYGAKRAKLGQAEPWTKVFGAIHLELGNETWNWGSFPGEGIPEAKAYATRVGEVFGAMRAAPLFEATKFDLVMDGWYAVPWWTEQGLTAVKTHADSIDMAPYTFDSYNDASSNEVIFGPMFAEGEFRDSLPNGLVMQNTKLAAKFGLKLDVYEVNLGGLGGKATQKDLDVAFPSVGAGVSVAEHMLLMMRDSNVNVQALFCLPEYANGFFNPDHPGSKDLMKLWGTVVDMGGQTNRVRPTFLAEQLANEAILPKMVETVHSGANPTWDQAGTTNAILNDQKIQMKGVHLLQSFAFADGGHSSLVIFNLSRDTALTITLAGAGAPKGVDVKMSRLTSAKITDSNEDSEKVKIQRETLTSFDASALYSLPPFSMTVLEWDSAAQK